MNDKYKVLFVCTANICRSPMAEVIFNELAEERGLNALATSAGVRATNGHDMAENSRKVLEEIGFVTGSHTSRRITRRMLEDSDLVLVMGPRHRQTIEQDFGHYENVLTLPEYTGSSGSFEVPDPYGLTLFAFRASVREIESYIEKTLDVMEQGSKTG